MISYDTKVEVLEKLDRLTRDLNIDSVRTFTTANIAAECHVSRSLASQHLNELVRQGLAIKVNTRPVIFLHRHAAERYFRCKLDKLEFASMQDLLKTVGMDEAHDFDKAIGFELSYGTCIEHLKSAIRYPPHGLPALLVGEHGTGKQLMSELTFEYGVNSGTLPQKARYIHIDCACYEGRDADLEGAVFGEGPQSGAQYEA